MVLEKTDIKSEWELNPRTERVSLYMAACKKPKHDLPQDPFKNKEENVLKEQREHIPSSLRAASG